MALGCRSRSPSRTWNLSPASSLAHLESRKRKIPYQQACPASLARPWRGEQGAAGRACCKPRLGMGGGGRWEKILPPPFPQCFTWWKGGQKV